MCRPVFMQTPESSPGGAAVSRGGRRARCRPPPRLGPQVRWAAGRPGPLSGRPSLGCSAAPGRPRPPPSAPPAAFSSGGSRPPPVAKPAPGGAPPRQARGAPLRRASAEGGLADRARPGASGAARGARVPAGLSGRPCLRRRGPGRGAPWRRGGRARAPSAGAAAPPPSPGLARPRCGAARQQAALWASVHSRPAPGLEGPGPGAEPLSEGRASSAPPPHLQAGPGGAGFLVLSRPGAWGLGAPRASERGAASRDRGPLTPCEAWPASPHPAPAAWGRGRRTAAPSVRPARQRGAAAGPRPAALGPGTAGAWGPPARSQGSSARGRRSWNWVGASGHRASARLLRRALAKRFLSRGHTRNGGCGGQRMCSWAWTSSPASRAPEGARGPLLRLT